MHARVHVHTRVHVYTCTISKRTRELGSTRVSVRTRVACYIAPCIAIHVLQYHDVLKYYSGVPVRRSHRKNKSAPTCHSTAPTRQHDLLPWGPPCQLPMRYRYSSTYTCTYTCTYGTGICIPVLGVPVACYRVHYGTVGVRCMIRVARMQLCSYYQVCSAIAIFCFRSINIQYFMQ